MRERLAGALAFPFEDREWLSKIAIGGAVGLVAEALFVAVGFLFSRELALAASPLALVANFPALGFALQVFQGALREPHVHAMPEWRRWSDLCLKGLLLFVLALGYGVLPLLFMVSGLGLFVRGGAAMVVGLVMMLLGMLAGLLLGFFLPMAVARYLEGRRVEAAFHPILIWQSIRKVLAEYMAAYLASLAACIIVGLIGTVPYLGALAWPFLAFYLMVAGARLFGGVCLGAA
jgi:hypothetical protein